MNKKIIYSLVGLALIFFIGSLIIFIRSSSDPKQKEPQVPVKEEAAEEQKEPELIPVKIFFLTEESRFMRPVLYQIEKNPIREHLYQNFISLMLQGKENYIVPAPQGLRVRTLYYLAKQQILVVDFSEELVTQLPSGTSIELEFIYFIVNNICYNFQEIKMVKLMIGGNEYKILGGHIDIAHPFYPDYKYIKDE